MRHRLGKTREPSAFAPGRNRQLKLALADKLHVILIPLDEVDAVRARAERIAGVVRVEPRRRRRGGSDGAAERREVPVDDPGNPRVVTHDERERPGGADGRRGARGEARELVGAAASLRERRRDNRARPRRLPLGFIASVRFTRRVRQRSSQLRVHPDVGGERQGDGEPARQTLELTARHVRLYERAPFERDEAVFRRRHANFAHRHVAYAVVVRASYGQIVSREPAADGDFAKAQDVAAEFDPGEGVGSRSTGAARVSNLGVGEVSDGVGPGRHRARSQRAAWHRRRYQRRDAGVRVNAGAVQHAGDGRRDDAARRRRLLREPREGPATRSGRVEE